MIIRRIGAMSVGKVFGALYAVIGLIVGAGFALIGIFAGMMPNAPENASAFGGMFGVAAIVIAPIAYGLMGFIGGIITAAVYNVVANAVGGVEVDIS